MDVCDTFLDLISARLDGELTDSEARELEAHLAQCPRCRALAEELETVHAAFPLLEELPAPEGFAAGVMDRVRAQEREKTKVVPLFRRPQFRAMASLAACAVLCLGLYQAGSFRGADNAELSGMAMGGSSAATAEPSEAPRAGEEDGAVMPNVALYDGNSKSESRSTDGTQENVPVGEGPSAVLTLSALPEGAGLDTQWLTDEEGRAYHIITGAQLEELLTMAQEQGITASLTGTPGPDGSCILMLDES